VPLQGYHGDSCITIAVVRSGAGKLINSSPKKLLYKGIEQVSRNYLFADALVPFKDRNGLNYGADFTDLAWGGIYEEPSVFNFTHASTRMSNFLPE